jgi:hypothetical protein
MAENSKGAKQSGKEDPGVLSGLSESRPSRIGGRRREPAGATSGSSDKTAKSKTSRPAKAKAASNRKAAAKDKAAAKPKKRAKTEASAETRAAGMPRRRTAGAPQEVHERGKPRPVRAGSPALEAAAPDAAAKRPAARTAPPPPPASVPNAPEMPSGTQLVTTAFQAAGELAQIGVTVGSQIIRRALDRLPKP